ncbi:Amyloid beta A4 precursor protein-binding family B member 1 [Chelonia mydas]|uniref:Amyloid beta A4 protein-binding family B member 1 n=1 Tax=Chelonia mydas TaxID=8469 RepID=M7AX07_CHEMY|nr:Amyloid beta A4 precursor protein-binding family B member 1 [Chelonia mydas]
MAPEPSPCAAERPEIPPKQGQAQEPRILSPRGITVRAALLSLADEGLTRASFPGVYVCIRCKELLALRDSVRALETRLAELEELRERERVPGAMSRPLSQRSDLANDNSCPGLSLALRAPHSELLNGTLPCQASPPGPRPCACPALHSALGPGPPPAEEPANAKWVKDGQNQLRQAAEQDQNRNELGPLATALLSDLPLGGPEEEEEEEDADSTPVQSDPITAESEQSSERAPREPGKSASLLFGPRASAPSEKKFFYYNFLNCPVIKILLMVGLPNPAGLTWSLPVSALVSR